MYDIASGGCGSKIIGTCLSDLLLPDSLSVSFVSHHLVIVFRCLSFDEKKRSSCLLYFPQDAHTKNILLSSIRMVY